MADFVERYDVHPRHFWLHGPRSGQPVEFDAETGMWNVYGYPEAHAIFSDPATFSSDTMRLIPKSLMPGGEDFSMEGFITQIDPPEHGKLRKLVSSAFTRKVVADLEPRIAALTHELLDAAAERGRFELVTDLAYPLPVIVIAELLGVPSGDRALFKRWADALFERDTKISLAEPAEDQDVDLQATLRPWKEMTDYLAGHAAERRTRPRADLLTKLVEAEVDGERLPDDQVVNFAIVLLLAGHITTTMLLGNTVLCLDAFPEQQDLVRADRSTIPAVIEEALRYLPPFAAVGRSTTREVELGGVTVPGRPDAPDVGGRGQQGPPAVPRPRRLRPRP